jgi:hypothetical protein
MQYAFGPGAPFEDDDAGVALQLAGLVAEDVPHQSPDRLGCGISGRGGGADEVGQPLLAEELPLR